MNIQESPLPPHMAAALPDWLPRIKEYLELEEAGFNPRDVRYGSFFRIDDSIGFVVFDYTADDGSPFAFIQYSLARGLDDSCIGCWPRTEGETLAWSIGEYFTMNPPGGE